VAVVLALHMLSSANGHRHTNSGHVMIQTVDTVWQLPQPPCAKGLLTLYASRGFSAQNWPHCQQMHGKF